MDNLLLTTEELTLLIDLLGQELIEVRLEWSAELLFETVSISIQADEIPIPTENNPWGDIDTLRIKKMTRDDIHIDEQTVLTNCGNITDIFRLESLVEIENPRQVEAAEILGVEMPAGQGWNISIYNPDDIIPKDNLHRTLLGLQFKTDKDVEFTFYTEGVGFYVRYYKGQGLPEELKDKCERIKIPNARRL